MCDARIRTVKELILAIPDGMFAALAFQTLIR